MRTEKKINENAVGVHLDSDGNKIFVRKSGAENKDRMKSLVEVKKDRISVNKNACKEFGFKVEVGRDIVIDEHLVENLIEITCSYLEMLFTEGLVSFFGNDYEEMHWHITDGIKFLYIAGRKTEARMYKQQYLIVLDDAISELSDPDAIDLLKDNKKDTRKLWKELRV